MARPAGHLRTAVVSATPATALALVGGWTWAADLVGPGFDPRVESISALASLETPHRWVMSAALVATGLGHVVTARRLGLGRPGRPRRARRRGSRHGGRGPRAPALAQRLVGRPHGRRLGLVRPAPALWPLLAARRDGPLVLSPRVARPAGAVLLVAVASLAVGLGGGSFGLHERVVAALTVLWPLVTAVGVWWSAGHRIGSRRLRHGLGVVLLTPACLGRAGRHDVSRPPPTPATTRPRWLSRRPRAARRSAWRRPSGTSSSLHRYRARHPGRPPGPGEHHRRPLRPRVSLADPAPGPGGAGRRRPRGGGRTSSPASPHGALVPGLLVPRHVVRSRPAPPAPARAGRGRRWPRGHVATLGTTAALVHDLPAEPAGHLPGHRGARHPPAQPGTPRRRRDPRRPGGPRTCATCWRSRPRSSRSTPPGPSRPTRPCACSSSATCTAATSTP